MTNKEKKYRLMELMFVILVSTIVGMISGGAAIFTMLDIKETNYVDKKDDLEEVGAVYEDILNNYYKEVNREDLIKGAIDGMMSILGDPNSSYYDNDEAESFNDRLSGRYLGVGLEIMSDGQGNTFVVGIFEGSPAAKSNLIKEGDFILEIDGVSVKDKTPEVIASSIKESAKDKVVITFERDGKQYKETLTASFIDIKSIESKVIEHSNKKIGYIKATIFAANTKEQFSEALKELESKKIDSLILDVRNNSGGYLTSVTEMLEQLLPKNTVLYKTKDSEKTTVRIDLTDEKRNYKIVVLTNEVSASASEIMAAALSEKYNAKLVGKKTYGKGTVQQVINTSTGGFAKITIQEWLTPNGKQIDKTGITPDYIVDLDMTKYDSTKIETDAQLQKALEVIVK